MGDEKSRRAEEQKAEEQKGSYPDGFCPGGTDEHSPGIDRWEQKSRRGVIRMGFVPEGRMNIARGLIAGNFGCSDHVIRVADNLPILSILVVITTGFRCARGRGH